MYAGADAERGKGLRMQAATHNITRLEGCALNIQIPAHGLHMDHSCLGSGARATEGYGMHPEPPQLMTTNR